MWFEVYIRNNRYWSMWNPRAVREVSLQVSSWDLCEISVRTIIVLVLSHESINSEPNVRLILQLFFEQLTDQKITLVFYAWLCNDARKEQLSGRIRWGFRRRSHKSMIMFSAITFRKFLWLLLVAHAGKKNVCDQSGPLWKILKIKSRVMGRRD
jgi:hypothetical protein